MAGAAAVEVVVPEYLLYMSSRLLSCRYFFETFPYQGGGMSAFFKIEVLYPKEVFLFFFDEAIHVPS